MCDADKITEKNIQGAPDLIIVFPEREYLERYSLINSTYGPPEIFNWDEILPMITFPDFAINLWDIFEKNPDEKPEIKPSPATQLSK